MPVLTIPIDSSNGGDNKSNAKPTPIDGKIIGGVLLGIFVLCYTVGFYIWIIKHPNYRRIRQLGWRGWVAYLLIVPGWIVMALGLAIPFFVEAFIAHLLAWTRLFFKTARRPAAWDDTRHLKCCHDRYARLFARWKTFNYKMLDVKIPKPEEQDAITTNPPARRHEVEMAPLPRSSVLVLDETALEDLNEPIDLSRSQLFYAGFLPAEGAGRPRPYIVPARAIDTGWIIDARQQLRTPPPVYSPRHSSDQPNDTQTTPPIYSH